MKVVSNTSPICYLVVIGHAHVIPELFGSIAIPPAVRTELLHESAPVAVRRWILRHPPWLTVETARPVDDPRLAGLHPGEREAILLAQSIDADLVVLDDKAARNSACERGLKVTGLLGVLAEAGHRGSIDLAVAVERLQKTNFRVSPGLLRRLLNGA